MALLGAMLVIRMLIVFIQEVRQLIMIDMNQLLNGFCLGTRVLRHSTQGIGTFVRVYVRGTYQSSKFHCAPSWDMHKV